MSLSKDTATLSQHRIIWSLKRDRGPTAIHRTITREPVTLRRAGRQLAGCSPASPSPPPPHPVGVQVGTLSRNKASAAEGFGLVGMRRAALSRYWTDGNERLLGQPRAVQECSRLCRWMGLRASLGLC